MSTDSSNRKSLAFRRCATMVYVAYRILTFEGGQRLSCRRSISSCADESKVQFQFDFLVSLVHVRLVLVILYEPNLLRDDDKSAVPDAGDDILRDDLFLLHLIAT